MENTQGSEVACLINWAIYPYWQKISNNGIFILIYELLEQRLKKIILLTWQRYSSSLEFSKVWLINLFHPKIERQSFPFMKEKVF